MRIPRVRRVWVAVGLLLFCAAACWATMVGYKAYYAREGYRLALQADLEDFFGLPVQVGRTEAEGLGVLALHDVKIWLPAKEPRGTPPAGLERGHPPANRGELIFESPTILWYRGGSDAGDGSRVDIRNAVWTLGSETWDPDDFSTILRASLQHDYSEQRIRQVMLTDAQVVWPRRDIRFTAEGVDGRIDFALDGTGRGTLTARSLNGHVVTEPVHIDAHIDPFAEELLPRVRMVVPMLPLDAIGLDRMTGTPITQGSFAGDVLLIQSDAHEEVRLSGHLTEVRLEQLTGQMSNGPLPGLVDLHLEEAVVRDRTLDSMTFRGKVQDLKLDGLLARWGLAGLGGEIDLEVRQGTWRGDALERLEFSGLWEGASLEVLSAALRSVGSQATQPSNESYGTLPLGSAGGWHGQLRVRVESLVLEHGTPVAGSIDVEALPRRGQAASIERSALLELVARMGVQQVPEHLLPERVQFSQMGVRIRIDHGRLRVSSGRGPAGPALMTLKLLGQNVPLVSDWQVTYDVDALLKQFRPVAEQWGGQLRQKLQQRLQGTTAPANAP